VDLIEGHWQVKRKRDHSGSRFWIKVVTGVFASPL
jgi:hypothetical protein